MTQMMMPPQSKRLLLRPRLSRPRTERKLKLTTTPSNQRSTPRRCKRVDLRTLLIIAESKEKIDLKLPVATEAEIEVAEAEVEEVVTEAAEVEDHKLETLRTLLTPKETQ